MTEQLDLFAMAAADERDQTERAHGVPSLYARRYDTISGYTDAFARWQRDWGHFASYPHSRLAPMPDLVRRRPRGHRHLSSDAAPGRPALYPLRHLLLRRRPPLSRILPRLRLALAARTRREHRGAGHARPRPPRLARRPHRAVRTARSRPAPRTPQQVARGRHRTAPGTPTHRLAHHHPTWPARTPGRPRSVPLGRLRRRRGIPRPLTPDPNQPHPTKGDLTMALPSTHPSDSTPTELHASVVDGTATIVVHDANGSDPRAPLAHIQIDLYRPDQLDLTITTGAHVAMSRQQP